MTHAEGVSVSEIIEAVARKRALLAPETAGYLVLGAADQVLANPGWVDEQSCTLLVDAGRVSVRTKVHCSPAEAETALRRLLQRLLASANGSAPALRSVAGSLPRGDIGALVRELESALIPVNRAAATRALSRLARETHRARESGALRDVERREPIAAPPEPAMSVEDAIAEASDDTDPMGVATSPETAPSEGPDFAHEAVTRKRPVLASELAHSEASSSDVDNLLEQDLSEPPPVDLAVLRAPLAPDIAMPDPISEPPPELSPDQAPAPSSVADPAPRPSSRPPSARNVDELLEEFIGGASRKSERVAEELRAMTGVEVPAHRRELPRAAAQAPGRHAGAAEAPFQHASGAADFYTSTPPPRAPREALASLVDDDPLERRSTRRRVYWLFGVLAVVTMGTVAVLRLEPGVLSGRTADVIEDERRAAASAAASIATRNAALLCRASLVVTDVPAGAEVLVRSGISPLDIDRLPSGARLEFVAVAEGYAPRRGVIPQGAGWDIVGGKPRFELPIVLEKSRAKAGTLDPWPAADPGTVVGGQGPPGSVHVVTSPKGAEVWMVAGGAPEAKVEALPCGAGMELLVAGALDGQPFRRHLRVDAPQLTPEPSANAVTARISAAK